MKTQEDLIELIENLNITLDRLDSEYGIYGGGCAYVCWILSEEFKKRGIKYKTVVYSHVKSTDVWSLAKNENVIHLTLEVNKTELGGEIEKDMMYEYGLNKFYTSMKPDDFKKIYETCQWNGEYDKSHNQEISDEIQMTFEMVW